MNRAGPAGTHIPGLVALAIVPALGRLWSRLIRARAAATLPPSLVLPYPCPRCCRRGAFEPRGDVPGSRPPSVVTRCRHCGSWFKVWCPGQWEEITGDEVEATTPEPRPRVHQLTLRRVMIAIALMAVSLSIPARMAWQARVAGQPFGVDEWLLMAPLPLLDCALAYACWSNAPTRPPPAGLFAWIRWVNVVLWSAGFVALTIFLVVMLVS
jgi:hypothetical protein